MSSEVHGPAASAAAPADPARSLREQVALLEAANRRHQLFIDILSHDLMNPVWIAENYLRLVTDEGIPADKRPFYTGMRNSLEKARGLLADARTYLGLQDRVAFTRESVDLGKLVEEVVHGLGPLGDEKGQQITVTLSGDRTVCAGPLAGEVLRQLLSNAINFSPPGSTIAVAVNAGPPVRLEVRDRGPGVPEEARERIFRRFESMEKGPVTGIGLGLAIVRRVVDLYGGRVWVEGHPGGGSIFIAEFPAGC